MRVLVIGGTKLTGPHIVRRLAELGHEVTVFHRGKSETGLPGGVRRLLGDRSRLAEFAPELRRLSPEVVLDMCALIREDATGLMSTFRGVARRVVVISSIDVYRAFGRLHRFEPGPPDPVPLTEESPLRTGNHPQQVGTYEKTHVEEAVMGDRELPATVLRYPAVYGPGDGMHRVYFEGLKRMFDGRPAILLDEHDARYRFSHGYSEDLALAAVRAVTDERAAGRVYNVAERETPPKGEWLRMLGEAAGWRGEIVTLPGERLPAHLRHEIDLSQELVVDTRRIREELGYVESVAVEEGLRRTVEWERSHPPDTVDPESFDYAAEDAVLASLR